MTTLKFRILIIFVMICSALAGPGYLVASSYLKMRVYQRDLNLAYQGRNLMDAYFGKRFKKNILNEIEKLQQNLNQESMKGAASKALSAYSSQQGSLMIRRQKEYNEVLKHFTEWVLPRIEYLEQRMLYFAMIGISLNLTLVAFLAMYVQRKILTPMRVLTVKMNDFLHDRYTYQFLLPDNNEVGELQSTFNSLAQRVLHNMEQLRTLDEAKSEFLSIASHELRTPLTAIKGSLNLLSSQAVAPIDTKSLNLVTIAEAETDRLVRLINDLLDITRIEAGRLPLRQTWFNLYKILHNTCESLAPLATAAKVQISSGPISANNIEVFMDKDRFVQILNNLLSNAIKFSPEGTSITVGYRSEPEGGLTIEVRDQGRGIPPHDLELIFQKFRQSTSPTNPLVKGTGLGLAIAKALIEEHGGIIGVESKPNIGSTFFFTITEWRQIDAAQLGDVA